MKGNKNMQDWTYEIKEMIKEIVNNVDDKNSIYDAVHNHIGHCKWAQNDEKAQAVINALNVLYKVVESDLDFDSDTKAYLNSAVESLEEAQRVVVMNRHSEIMTELGF